MQKSLGKRSNYKLQLSYANETFTPTNSLVVVLVAQGRANGVENRANVHIWTEAVHVDIGAGGERVASRVSAAGGGDARVTAHVLPDAEVAVDEGVVQEEDWVGGRGIHILHNSANTIVTPGMSTSFSASSHISVCGTAVASINHGVSSVGGLRVVSVARQAVTAVAASRADVNGEVGKLLRFCQSG